MGTFFGILCWHENFLLYCKCVESKNKRQKAFLTSLSWPPHLLCPSSSCLWPRNQSQCVVLTVVSTPKMPIDERGKMGAGGCSGVSFAKVFLPSVRKRCKAHSWNVQPTEGGPLLKFLFTKQTNHNIFPCCTIFLWIKMALNLNIVHWALLHHKIQH